MGLDHPRICSFDDYNAGASSFKHRGEVREHRHEMTLPCPLLSQTDSVDEPPTCSSSQRRARSSPDSCYMTQLDVQRAGFGALGVEGGLRHCMRCELDHGRLSDETGPPRRSRWLDFY